MDINKLTDSERINVFKYYGTLANIQIIEGSQAPIEMIDLYIATALNALHIEIPPELNIDTIDKNYYSRLAPVLYLSTAYTPENLHRAKRIIRIIRDIHKQKMAYKAVEIVPLRFTAPGLIGDFNWMIKQKEYDDTLFLFNDNEEQFIAFAFMNQQPEGCTPGGGNAVIRPYQCTIPIRAAGIPTGNRLGGYKNLQIAKPLIDRAFNHIRNLLNSGDYDRVAYSAAADGYSLGTAIFSPSQEVKDYIVDQIYKLT